jgi:hypothetical protein
MIGTKCQQSGAPTCSRLCGRDDAESRLKIGAPNPEVYHYLSTSSFFERIFSAILILAISVA